MYPRKAEKVLGTSMPEELLIRTNMHLSNAPERLHEVPTPTDQQLKLKIAGQEGRGLNT